MKKVALILLIVILVGALWLLSNKLNVFPMHDFVEYWASGRLNFTGGDPYNSNQMIKLEQSVGWNENEVLMMWTPPWSLPFGMLFGLFSYSFSRMLWFLIQIFIFFACAIVLWRTYGGEKRHEWMAWIAMLGFGPVLQTLKLGQVTVLVLLGSVGFLYFLQKDQDYIAGLFASMVLIKPHLLYLFVLAVIFWSIAQRRFKVLIGFAAAIVFATLIAWIFNPSLFTDYIRAVQTYPPEDWITATLGTPLRYLFGTDKFYLQFVPPVFGVIWFLVFWIKRYKTWEWKAYLPLLILVSMVTSAYGWAFDVAVCVWAAIQITALFNFKLWTLPKILIVVSFWVVSLLSAFLSVSQHYFWWLSSFFLVWYLVTYHYLSQQNSLSMKPVIQMPA